MNAMMIPDTVRKGHGKCPACGKKGLKIANHPPAYGHKDTSRFICRYCQKVFKMKEKQEDRPGSRAGV
jgi:hypothetical protein